MKPRPQRSGETGQRLSPALLSVTLYLLQPTPGIHATHTKHTSAGPAWGTLDGPLNGQTTQAARDQAAPVNGGRPSKASTNDSSNGVVNLREQERERGGELRGFCNPTLIRPTQKAGEDQLPTIYIGLLPTHGHTYTHTHVAVTPHDCTTPQGDNSSRKEGGERPVMVATTLNSLLRQATPGQPVRHDSHHPPCKGTMASQPH